MKTAIYAGSFDPPTSGHCWVIGQALAIFDKLYIAIGTNPGKNTTFNLEQRIRMIKNAFPNEPKIEVVSFENQFLVNFCRAHNIDVMVRGIRNVQDLEYETQILYINEMIDKSIKSVYFIPPTELAGVSSSMVKGLIQFPEWQFTVEKLIPKANMSMFNALAYSKDLFEMQSALNINIGLTKISEAYSANGRYYHTLQHIVEMLKALTTVGFTALPGPFDWRRRVLYEAALYHDIVYNPLSKTNEEESVAVFIEDMKRQELYTREEIDFGASLIMATKHHEGDSLMHNLMIDADLWILSSPEARFNEYERQIRAEYGMIPDIAYVAGRRDFVENMLKRPKIYLTESFASKEEDARKNLTNLLNKLK